MSFPSNVSVKDFSSLNYENLNAFQGPDLTTFGELYAEGSFRISGAKAFRHIFLFEHMLLVTKKKEAGILNYKTHILVSKAEIIFFLYQTIQNFVINLHNT